VRLEGEPVALSAKEFQLVATLASEPERVFTKADLLETVWGFRSQGRTRTGEEMRRWRAGRPERRLGCWVGERFDLMSCRHQDLAAACAS
jgi:hypothetical protein